MAAPSSSGPRLMWLARVGIVLILLDVLVMSQVAGMDLIDRRAQGATTTFTLKWWVALVWLTPALPMGLLAMAFWVQPRRLFKLVGFLLAAMAMATVAFMVPTTFVHRAVLTPDGFDLRMGSWTAPRSYSIRFKDVEYAAIEEDPEGGSRRSRDYVLACYSKARGPKDPVLLPINDMVKRALRPIVKALEASGALLPDHGPSGPPELAEWLR